MTGSVSLGALAFILAIGLADAVQPQPPKPATPIEPISAILQQFKSQTLVALGDNEASVQGSEFRIKLVRDPRFAAVVNDIVVEFGNSRYQDLIDRSYPWRGSPPTIAAACMAGYDSGRDTPGILLSIYEQFFQAIREVNYSLQGSREALGAPRRSAD